MIVNNKGYHFPVDRIGTECTEFEKQNILHFDQNIKRGEEDREYRKKYERLYYFDRRHNFNMIEMNSTFIEFINTYHPLFGRGLGAWIFIFGPLFYIFGGGGLISGLFFIPLVYEEAGVLLVIPLLIGMIIFLWVIWLMTKTNIPDIKRYELNGYYYQPVRFNRKDQKVYIFTEDGEQIERNIRDLRFVISEAKGVGGTPNYELSIMVVGKGGKIKYHTTIGQKTHNLAFLRELWNLINIYMVHGPQPLMPTNITGEIIFHDDLRYITYCNDVKEKEPTWFESWQRIRLMHYQNIFLSWTILPIFDLFHLIGRRICIGRKKMPVWSAEIEAKNQVDADDPYVVTAKDNFVFTSMDMERPYRPKY